MSAARWRTLCAARTSAPTRTAARPAALASANGRRAPALRLLAALALCVGCEPALVEYAPEQIQSVPLALFPTSGRQGRSITLIAMPAVSSFVANDLYDYDLGEGIEAPQFDTNGGQGCELDGVAQLLDFLGENYEDRYPICFFARIDAGAPPGPRVVTLALVSDGAPRLARATFTVFAAAPVAEAP